jgi:hypothetical protein
MSPLRTSEANSLELRKKRTGEILSQDLKPCVGRIEWEPVLLLRIFPAVDNALSSLRVSVQNELPFEINLFQKQRPGVFSFAGIKKLNAYRPSLASCMPFVFDGQHLRMRNLLASCRLLRLTPSPIDLTPRDVQKTTCLTGLLYNSDNFIPVAMRTGR